MLRRRGLTRIEVLVILAIVVLLAGLIVTGLVRLREQANLGKCRNNLRQLGLAVQNYRDCNDRLPPLTDQGKGAPTGRGLPSVFANLVPFVEATPYRFRPDQTVDFYHAHSSVPIPFNNKDGTFGGTDEGGMANHPWRIFTDPADASAERLRDVPITLPDSTTGFYAAGSYAVNGLLDWGARGFPASPPNWSPDTILMAERPQLCRTATGDEIYNLWGLGIYSPHMPTFATLTPTDPPGLLSTGQIAPVAPLPVGNDPDEFQVRVGRRDAAPETAEIPSPIQRIRSSRPCDPRLPGTPHAAGMQVLMADGSVHVFTTEMNPFVFWAACVPASRSGEPGDG